MAFKETTVIHAPVKSVFDIVTDFSQAPFIMEHIVRTEKLTEGPMQVGTQIKEVRNIRGKEAATVLTVAEFNPHQTFVVKSEMSGITVTYQYDFMSFEEGTKVDFKGSIKSKGLKNMLIKPIFESMLKKEDKDHLEKIKAYIEKED